MSDIITNRQKLDEWITEGLSDSQRLQTSKWREIWIHVVEGAYSEADAESFFQNITRIGNKLGNPDTFKVRASEGRRVWRYSRRHNAEALALLKSDLSYHAMIKKFPTTSDTSWRDTHPFALSQNSRK